MLGRIDLARPQVSAERSIPTRGIKWQEAVAIIVSVEKPLLLFTVHRVLSDINVEDNLLGRFIVGGDVLIDEGRAHPRQLGAVDPVLEPLLIVEGETSASSGSEGTSASSAMSGLGGGSGDRRRPCSPSRCRRRVRPALGACSRLFLIRTRRRSWSRVFAHATSVPKQR